MRYLVVVLFLAGFFLGGCVTGGRDCCVGGGVYDVREFGAVGDGEVLCTEAIQGAVDECAQAGGGVVRVVGGVYRSGTVELKDNVTLRVCAGATLLGSTDVNDYVKVKTKFATLTSRYTQMSLIWAEGRKNVSVVGRGVIDGQGASFFAGPPFEKYEGTRPFLMRIASCEDVLVRDITLRNPGMWTHQYLDCNNVVIDGITVDSLSNHNNDGIDIDCCEYVRISNCYMRTKDDSITIKSTGPRVCENIVITNCTVSSRQNAIKLGTESNGGFENIVISNCTVQNSFGGIILQMNDGGSFSRVNVSNIVMENVEGPIGIRLGNRGRKYADDGPECGVGTLRNVMISNIQATGVGTRGASIVGLPEQDIENVTLSNIRLEFKGGESLARASKVVEEPARDKYPTFTMYGVLPSYGFFCRYVDNLRFDNVELSFDKVDHRPAIICEKVKGLDINGLMAEVADDTPEVIRLVDVEGAIIRGCRFGDAVGNFLSVAGCKGVSVVGNDLSGVKRVFSGFGVRSDGEKPKIEANVLNTGR